MLFNDTKAENTTHPIQQLFLEESEKSTKIVNNKYQETIKKKIQKHINKMKEIYDILMIYLEESDDNEINFQNLRSTISKQKLDEDKRNFGEFLQLVATISNNYNRKESFFKKIFQIIHQYETQIKQTFTNNEIFGIFESNKMILFFLFQKEILTIDDDIYNKLICKFEANGNRYCHFFYSEIKKFIGREKIEDIERELLMKNPNIFDCFDEKRNEGENDNFICSLIREDSIEEFVEYVNRANISLNSEIKSSIFETNQFLIENKNTTLIEYSAFFGSIQVFQYLRLNGVELTPSLWIFAIHSRNAELIHLLEAFKVDPPNQKFENCLCESIKCHYNELVDYIENNLLPQNDGEASKSEEIFSCIMKFRNYAYFPTDFENGDAFFNLCSFNYSKLVKLYTKMRKESIKKIISETIETYFLMKSL